MKETNKAGRTGPNGNRKTGRGGEIGEISVETLKNCTFPVRLSLLRNSLTEAEKRVGDYFLKNSKAVYLSITEVAQQGELGYGSIIRFCQKIGCSGFQDFKVLLAQELRHEDSKKAKQTCTPLANYIAKLEADIANTAKLIDPKVMEMVARSISRAKFVLISGIAGSASLAHGLNYHLSRIGVYSTADCDGWTMAVRAATLQKDDVFLGMSFSGSTKDVIKAAQIAKERGAVVVAVTAFLQSPLGEVADYTLVGASDHDPFSCEIFPNSPRDFILDLLITEICEIRPDAMKMIQRTFEAVSDRRI